jgi:hypothetical protein
MATIADEAGRHLLDRYCPPRVEIEKLEDGQWRISCPYAQEDDERWWFLLAEAFGTRDLDVISYFLDSLGKLCPAVWDDERKAFRPREVDFNALLAIVGSVRPQNEAQAAYAAQLAALHISAMKLGGMATERYCDARTVAILNKTVRAYGDGIERLARLQGKIAPRAIHQTFEVHKHEHVHVDGGAAPFGGQPHGATAGETISSTALPGPCPNGEALPLPGSERQESVPRPRWGARIWRALRRS